MGTTDLREVTTTTMQTSVPNFKVGLVKVDEASGDKETIWDNDDFDENYSYYQTIPELKQSIDSFARWITGKGYITDAYTKIILEQIQGWGEDSFDAILWNMVVTMFINGDSYAEIIRADDKDKTLINLKVLNPKRIRHVVDSKGIIIRYEEINTNPTGKKEVIRKFEKKDIFHLCNNRVVNEIHGTSLVKSCKWIIDARNEAMSDKRRILHRSTIRVIEVDTNDRETLRTLRREYAEAIKQGEVLLVPKDNVAFPNIPPLSTAEHSEWIRYLENIFYQAVGVPKIILGGSQEFTEASAKIGYLTFEQPYMAAQRMLEQDLWNQLGISLTFNRPVSLKDEMQASEAANTGQVGFQKNDANVGVTGE